MTSLDKKFRPLTLKKLKQYGKSIVYSQTVEGEYNPVTSEATTTTTNFNIKGLFSGVSSGDITSGLATATDIKIIIAAVDIENPTTKDIIDNKYPVTYVKPHYSGDLIAYFELICKAR